jgi:uncharacterized protein YuzB (UPF0349 family)
MEKTINDILREYDEAHDVEIDCTTHCEGCIDRCEHYVNANFVDNWIDAHKIDIHKKEK